MSGVRRLFLFFLLSGLATAAAAQSNVVAPPPPPRPDTVGPEQLRNFALPGTQSRPEQTETAPATTAPATTTTPTRPAPATTTTLPPAVRERPATSAATSRTGEAGTAAPSGETVSVPLPQAQRPATSVPGTGLGGGAFAPSSATPAPDPSPVPSPALPVSSSPVDGIDEGSGGLMRLWPVLALALAAGALFWWWTRRRAEADGAGKLAFAGSPSGATDPPAPHFAPPPRPVPAPAPLPEVPVRAPSVGLVSSRLRAWLDLDLAVRVAAITGEELQLEVDIVLTNNGSAAAREIAVEALLINAGAEQEGEITTFFTRPDSTDFARDSVEPMSQMVLSAALRMPRGAFREYAVGGGTVVVPIVALNASYKAGGSRGRTCAAFLVGRAGAEADKLGPFPTDAGNKGFNRLGLKRLPEQVRR